MTLEEFFKNRRVAVTGASGSVGQQLVRQLLAFPVTEVVALDDHENAMFYMWERYRGDPRVHVFSCDIRMLESLERFCRGVDYIFHTAALKHVILCERSPFEAVRTNILGVENVIRAALMNDVKKVLFTSTDKAVNPTSVMGTSKLMGERLITAATALSQDESQPTFASTRFGNVAGSGGSVIPLFCHQIEAGGPITLTSAEMTRFVMTLDEAVRLVLVSQQLACGGEVFVTKMPVVRIIDVAEVMAETIGPLFGHSPKDIEIKVVGPRPGEKFFEELITEEETRRTVELAEMFALTPAFTNVFRHIEYQYQGVIQDGSAQAYNSSTQAPLSKSDIATFLLQPDVLPNAVRERLASAGGTDSRDFAA